MKNTNKQTHTPTPYDEYVPIFLQRSYNKKPIQQGNKIVLNYSRTILEEILAAIFMIAAVSVFVFIFIKFA